MVTSKEQRRRQTQADVSRHAWLSESDLQAAGCVTVVVGADDDAVAQAFGIDLIGPTVDPEQDDVMRTACVSTVAGGVVLAEDNGVEGTREVVLKASSKRGVAASIFWNVNALVVFSCARRGKMVFTGEIGYLDDPDDRAGLPRALTRFVELASEDDVDLVATGAAMVAAYTGVPLAPQVLDGQWREVDPVVDEPERMDARHPGLLDQHPGLLEGLLAVAPGQRRALTRVLAVHAAGRASLAEYSVVVEVLDSVSSTTPGTPTPALEAMASSAVRALDHLSYRLNADEDEEEAERAYREESPPVARAHWLATALRHACTKDDVSALLGVAHCDLVLHMRDDTESEYVELVRELTAAPPAQWDDIVRRSGAPPSAHDREQEQAELRQRHQQEVDDDDARNEAYDWNGVFPSERMRQAHHAAWGLAQVDPRLLVDLDALGDPALRELAVWTARRLLTMTGLLDRPWLAEHVAVMDQPLGDDDDAASEKHDRLFELLDQDGGVPWSTHRSASGYDVSEQHFALPVVWGVRQPDAFAAATDSLATLHEALGPRAPQVVAEARARSGLPAS